MATAAAATITTTLGVLVNAYGNPEQPGALKKIGALDLHPRSAYHYRKLVQAVEQEVKHFDAERARYIKELGEPPGEAIKISTESANWKEFMRRIDELAKVEVTLQWGPMTLAMLGDEKVKGEVLAGLGPLFSDELEDKP